MSLGLLMIPTNVQTSGVVFSFESMGKKFFFFIVVDFEREQLENNPNLSSDSIVVFDESFVKVPSDDGIYPVLKTFIREEMGILI